VVEIFHTHSDVEARIVRGLLEAHGLMSVTASSAAPHAIWPVSIGGLAEIRLSVHESEAEDARRIIDSHRTEVPNGQVVRLRDEFEGLQQAIGYRFRDRGMLEHAMTHTSRANEDVSGGVVDNESLEFLGDAVLGFVIADLLFHEFPLSDEGQKSKAKAALVSTAALADLAQRIGLGAYLLLGRGEEKTGGRTKLALLADGCEAVIAAIYLDGGVEQARAFILRELEQEIERVRSPLFMRDYKSALQERLQAGGRPLPEYDVAGERGPDHDKRFHVVVRVAGQMLAESEGRTKKEAEQEAARLALELLRDDARR
jgi:ribonuclease-3